MLKLNVFGTTDTPLITKETTKNINDDLVQGYVKIYRHVYKLQGVDINYTSYYFTMTTNCFTNAVQIVTKNKEKNTSKC